MKQPLIFDTYFKEGLLPSLGGSDDIYNNLKKAANNITSDLEKNQAKIIPYTLVALDNDISKEEPILEEVENHILEHWKMLRDKFKDLPITLYRAIILQALENLVKKDPKYATIIWLSGIDVYSHINIAEKERKLLFNFLYDSGDKAEEYAVEEWSVSKDEINIAIPKFKLTLDITHGEIDLEQLTDSMTNASGPYAKGERQTRTEANPYWSNSQQHWSFEFAPRAAEGIKESVDIALNEQSESIDKNTTIIQTELNNFFSKLAKNLRTSFKSAIQSSVAVEQRSQLLWWKETLYSRKLRESYRNLSKFKCAIAMACDLYELLPSIFPISVDYILRETYNTIHKSEDNVITLEVFLEAVHDTKNKDFLEKYFEEESIEEGRTTLDSFIKRVLYSRDDYKKDTLYRLGIAPDTKIKYEEFSVWLLHCLAVKRLIK